MALGLVREIGTRKGFEPEDKSAGPNAGEAKAEPLAEIERRSRHRGVVIVALMVVETLGERFQVRQRQRAGRGSQKRVLLVNRFEGSDVGLRQADRCDHGWEASAGTDIEDADGGGWRRGRCMEMGEDVEAVDDVGAQIVLGACSGEIDAAVPATKDVYELTQDFLAIGGKSQSSKGRSYARHE